MPDAERAAGAAAHIDDMTLLAAAAAQAGEIALSFFRADPQVWMKAGNSPVSEADLAVDHFLKERLLAARPGYGWLSEETADDPSRLGCARVFVIDPIDGTRAFLAGREEWAISAAVVENGVPVAAALFQPTTGMMLTAAKDHGAWHDNAALHVTGRVALAGGRIAVARRVGEHPAFADAHLDVVPNIPSLALRIARVAEGRLDLAFASGNAHDWDLAAADLLVREAGGVLLRTDLRPVVYNAPEPRHTPLLAAGTGLLSEAVPLFARVNGLPSEAWT